MLNEEPFALVDALVELDQLNMAPIIEQAGGQFEPERRRKCLIEEIKAGAEVFVTRKQEKITGYLQYQGTDNWKVMSIQIHPEAYQGSVLLNLLRQAGQALATQTPKSIESSVHVNNQLSLRLHQKLGFTEVAHEDGRVRFRISGEDLRRLLKRLTKSRT